MKDDVLIYVPNSKVCNTSDNFEYTTKSCDGKSSTGTVALKITIPSATPKPTAKPHSKINSNSANSNDLQSNDGSALGNVSLILMMALTGMIGLLYIRKEEV